MKTAAARPPPRRAALNAPAQRAAPPGSAPAGRAVGARRLSRATSTSITSSPGQVALRPAGRGRPSASSSNGPDDAVVAEPAALVQRLLGLERATPSAAPAAPRSSCDAGAVEAQHPRVVAVQVAITCERVALAGPQHAAQHAERGGGVAPVDGVGEVPRRHRAGLAEERLDVGGASASRPGAERGVERARAGPAGGRRPRPSCSSTTAGGRASRRTSLHRQLLVEPGPALLAPCSAGRCRATVAPACLTRVEQVLGRRRRGRSGPARWCRAGRRGSR